MSFSMVLYQQTKDIYLDGDNYVSITNIYLIVLRIISYILPLLILSFVSMKFERNYKQILITSIYMQVMYEYPSRNLSKNRYIWESNKRQLSNEMGDAYGITKINMRMNKRLINSELSLVSLFVGMFQGVMSVIEIYEVWYPLLESNFWYVVSIFQIPAIILVLFAYVVWNNTSIKQLNARYVDFYKDKIIDIAVSNNVITENERDDCFDYIKISL